MSTGPLDDDSGDIDPADLDDLGDLGGEDDDDDADNDTAGASAIPTAEEWAKAQRKAARQEARITKLLGGKAKTPGKVVSDVDKALLDQIRGGKAKDPKDDDDDSDSGEAAKWRGIAVQQAASAQIAAAGFQGTAKQAARLARLIDTSDMEPDRHGNFDLEDEIDELVEEYPTLFGKGQPARRVAPRVRTASSDGKTPAKDANRSTSDAMLKSAGYK